MTVVKFYLLYISKPTNLDQISRRVKKISKKLQKIYIQIKLMGMI